MVYSGLEREDFLRRRARKVEGGLVGFLEESEVGGEGVAEL